MVKILQNPEDFHDADSFQVLAVGASFDVSQVDMDADGEQMGSFGVADTSEEEMDPEGTFVVSFGIPDTSEEEMDPEGTFVIGYVDHDGSEVSMDADGEQTFNPVDEDFMIGAIIAWPSNDIPDHWMECNGSTIDRVVYSALFAIIGNNYGPPDPEHFTLPDFRSRVIVGRGPGEGSLSTRILGETGGEEEHVLLDTELPSISHGQDHLELDSIAGGGDGSAPQGDSASESSNFVAYPNANDEPHNNMQPYGVATWIIRVS